MTSIISTGVSNASMLDCVVSACCIDHIGVWKHASRGIVNNIRSKQYIVIVPDKHLSLFREHTPYEVDVISEETVIGSKFKEEITRYLKVSGIDPSRASWIYQQFLKIQISLVRDKKILIWDSDTIPLKELEFIDKNGKISPFFGQEYHVPYFTLIKRLLGINKQIKPSFIAQSLPLYSNLLIDMVQKIEERIGLDWKYAILSTLTADLGGSPFSEYETIGNYMLSQQPSSISFDNKSAFNWMRDGTEIVGSPENIDLFLPPPLNTEERPSFITFESWQDSCKQLKSLALSEFLSKLFSTNKYFNIVQVGANDGVHNDPLRPHLPMHRGNVILVEALPYYCSKLESLYHTNDNVHICNALVSDNDSEIPFFFIDPLVAEEMDGDGPFNKWAHAQGSLKKEIIIQWIHSNAFRGSRYVENIDRYVSSIKEIHLVANTLDQIADTYCLKGIDLLVLDVQGNEYNILKNLPCSKRKPRIIIYEDDSSLVQSDRLRLESMLIRMNYVYVLGESDKLWIRL